MESKDITVTLAPGHEVTLTTDAPDIKARRRNCEG